MKGHLDDKSVIVNRDTRAKHGVCKTPGGEIRKTKEGEIADNSPVSKETSPESSDKKEDFGKPTEVSQNRCVRKTQRKCVGKP